MTTLFPKLLSNKPWQSSSIAIRKPYIYAEANTAIIGYKENDYGYIAQVNLAQPEVLQPIAQLDKVLDIAVCFDARWSYQSGLYKYYTIGEPYIATIDNGNRLYIQYGVEGAKQQLATSATKVKLVRGWKHISVPQDDQGLCAIYLKSGRLYSREYVQQANGTYAWTVESQINLPISLVREYEVYRTVDYRIVLVVSDGVNSYTCASTRLWPGTSVPYETIAIKSTISNTRVKLAKIDKLECSSADSVNVQSASTGTKFCYEYNVPQNAVAFNNGGHIINLVLANRPTEDDLLIGLGNLSVKDSLGIAYSIHSAYYAFPYIVLEMLDINNASGDITVSYTTGWHKPNGDPVEAFSVTFTPTGLVPVAPDPPVIVSISNVDTEVV